MAIPVLRTSRNPPSIRLIA